MFNLTMIGGALVIVTLVILAIVKNSYVLRIITTVALMLSIAFREDSFGSAQRSLNARSALTGDMLGAYAQGVNDMASYCVHSGIFVYAALVSILLICVRGFRKSNKK